MKYRYLLMMIIGLLMTGCTWAEGWDVVADFFGANTPPDKPSMATTVFGTAGFMLPGGLGLAVIGFSKLLHGALVTKQAMFESTQAAIENGSLVAATSADEVKAALNHAQNLHHASKLLESAYKTHNEGGIVSKIIKKISRN